MAGRLKIAVRELVEFCCRSGDLGSGNGTGVSALTGLRTHQKIQRRYAEKAKAEYVISRLIRIDNHEIELAGRIDLLFVSESPPRIEEIKTVQSISTTPVADSTHWGQLKCYAACYAAELGLEQISISLNRVNPFNLHETRTVELWQHSALEHFLRQILGQYLSWHQRVQVKRRSTLETACALIFPFTRFRPQQYRFAAEVFRTIKNRRRLSVEAPTGSGKTISTLFPSIKALGENCCEQIIYLSAKVSGQRQAVNAIELLIEKGLDISYLVIQAKARSCPCNVDSDEVDDEECCKRCLGFFDRLADARERLLACRQLDVNPVQAIAREFNLCPFALSLQMLPWVDIVICDFNYVFDPVVQLGYFKTDTRPKVLLIDELHNLVDRARNMYSCSLVREQIKLARRSNGNPPLARALQSIEKTLDQQLRSQHRDEQVIDAVPDKLLKASYRFSEKFEIELFSKRQITAETLAFSRENFRFQCISQHYGCHHKSIGIKPLAKRQFKLVCLNAIEYLQACYPMFQAICGFSATLSPGAYFRPALGFGEEEPQLKLPSAFPQNNLQVCIGSFVDTRYRHRENYIDTISHTIYSSYQIRPGNYLVFFSSHDFMQRVFNRFIELYPQTAVCLQQRHFDEREHQNFLERFIDNGNQLGFAIMGGRFAEGIDYQGEALVGAIIVGVGLPRVSDEQQLVQRDFESMQMNGFDFAFRYPGLIRVMQSAGRVIRSERDRGVIVLLDRRFQQQAYRKILPPHWHPDDCANLQSLNACLGKFWHADGDPH